MTAFARVSRLRWVIALVATSCALLVGATVTSGQAAGPDTVVEAQRTEAVTKARGLVVSPDLNLGSADGMVTAGTSARAAGERLRDSIPLPPGGNFNGIQWDAVEGGLTTADIQFVMQYNAACQWALAAAQGVDKETALEVLSSAGRWPAHRNTELQGLWQSRAQSLVASDASVPAECRESHRREVAYATSRGLTPPR